MIYDSRFYEYNLLIDTNVMNEFTVVESQELITCNKYWPCVIPTKPS